jgi:hypothetical protein
LFVCSPVALPYQQQVSAFVIIKKYFLPLFVCSPVALPYQQQVSAFVIIKKYFLPLLLCSLALKSNAINNNFKP